MNVALEKMNAWDIFWNKFANQGGYELVLEGLRATLLIAIFGLLIGFVVGSVLAVFKLLPSHTWYSKVLGWVTNIYVALFRGTPMVVQLLLVHFVFFPAMNVDIPPEAEGIIAFGLNSGAYICEIMRGGILSVDKGQMEAGRAIGLGYATTMFRIVVPQAIKNVVPTLGNEFIALLKETSVVSFITIIDITSAFQAIANSTYEFIVPYIILALFYLVLVLIVTLVIKLVERRLHRSDRR